MNCNSGKEIEAVTEILAVVIRSASAFALMLKVGLTVTIPGISSPLRLVSKTVRFGVWKLPVALATTLKVAETSPVSPTLKAYTSSGQEVGIYRTDWPTY